MNEIYYCATIVNEVMANTQKPETRTRTGSTAAAKKNPCGKCQDECATGNAIVCGFCESWYHSKCVEGMTPEFIKCCDAINKYYGGSSFLCGICRKIMGALNHSMKEMVKKMSKMEAESVTAALERKVMAGKIENLESKSRQVNENVQKMEGEVAAGMEKAKEEVKDEMKEEMEKREKKKSNIVVYGLKESEEEDGKKRQEEDMKTIKEMATVIDVEIKGEVKGSYRAGKKEGDRPRPLVVTLDDDETREGFLANARRMAGKDTWKKVFVGQDLTWRQREEARKEEKKLKEDAERRTEEENTRGRVGKCVVVGQRGRKWLKWVTEIRGE